MKKIFLGSCAVVLSAAIISCSSTSRLKTPIVVTPPADTLISTLDTFAYGLGMNIGNNLKDQGVTELNFAALQRGMKDVFSGSKEAITELDANNSIQTILQGLATKKAAAEKAAGVAFLDSNKLHKEIIVLPSGLQYEILKKGDPTSVMPKAEDTIIAHYAGSLINGKEFDNSYKRGQPLTIKANEVIKGWTEIVQHMHIGEKVKMYIPSELGYGERGAGADIPPGAVLIFQMELLGVKPFVQPVVQTPKDETVPPVPVANKPVKNKVVKTKTVVKTKPAHN